MRSRLLVPALGAAFGFVIEWARLSDPEVIHAMLRLREPDVFLLMGSAIATAALGARLLRRYRVRTLAGAAPVSWSTLRPTRDHLVGSALFGLGWSVASTCPGPIAVQLATGRWSAIPTALGLMGGIVLRDVVRLRRVAEPAVASGEAEAAPIGL